MKISGEGSYVDAKGQRHKVEGTRTLSDDTLLRNLSVSGIFSFDKISCDTIKVRGECYGDSLAAKNFFVEGMVKVNSVNVTNSLTVTGSLKVIDVEATEISIESQLGSINTVKCKQMKIFNNDNVAASPRTRVRIKNIIAEKVELKNCEAEVIRCQDAFIGVNCAIEKLFVAGECKISVDSTVGEMIRI